MRVFRHLVAVILLGLAIGTPWASAAEPRPGVHQAQQVARSTPDLIDGLRNLLMSFWSTMGLGASTKEGCAIDPWGRCITAPNKTGCAIDPAGRCITAPESGETDSTLVPVEENGCAIDPLGTP
jgi:hypothetical protein